MTTAIKKLYARSTAFAAIGKTLLAVSGVISVWQLNLLLSKDSFGAFMIVFALYQVVASTLASGFKSLILYHTAGNEDTSTSPSAILGYSIVISLLIVALFTSAAPLIASLFQKADLTPLVQSMAGYIPAFTFSAALTSYYRAQQNIKTLTLYNEILPAAARIIGLGLCALWLPAHAPLTLSVISSLFIASFALPACMLYLKNPLGLNLHKSQLTRADMAYALQTAGGSFLSKSARNMAILLVGGFASTAITADFALAARFSQLLLLPKNALIQLLTPRLRVHLKNKDTSALSQEFKATQALMSILTLFGLILCLWLAPSILPLFGQYGQNSYSILLILCYASLVRAAFGDIAGLLTMAGQARATLSAQLIGLALMIAGFATLMTPLGAPGAAWATALSAIGALSSMALRAHQSNLIKPLHTEEILLLSLTAVLIGTLTTLPTTLATVLTITAGLIGILTWYSWKTAPDIMTLFGQTLRKNAQ